MWGANCSGHHTITDGGGVVTECVVLIHCTTTLSQSWLDQLNGFLSGESSQTD